MRRLKPTEVKKPKKKVTCARCDEELEFKDTVWIDFEDTDSAYSGVMPFGSVCARKVLKDPSDPDWLLARTKGR